MLILGEKNQVAHFLTEEMSSWRQKKSVSVPGAERLALLQVHVLNVPPPSSAAGDCIEKNRGGEITRRYTGKCENETENKAT